MPPEELNALEMIRDMVGAKLDLANASDECLNDIWIAAQIALREHPADDDEKVTAEWLDVLGFEYGNLSGLYIRNPRWSRHETPTNVFTKVVPHPETRGDVRRLCRALGIELKEPT